MKHLFTIFLTMVVHALTANAQHVESFTINGKEGAIYTELQRPQTDNKTKIPLVIICHGFGGNCNAELLTDISNNLLDNGIASIRFDFDGHGKSDGEFVNMTVPKEIQDLKSVIAWAQSQPWVKNISLSGHSQGGVVASMTAGQLGPSVIKSVVLLAPAAVLRDDALRGSTMGAVYDPWEETEGYVQLPFGNMKLGREYIRTAMTLPIYETALQYTGPVLIMHGTHDRIVPYTYGERYHYGYKHSNLKLIDGEDHGFTKTGKESARNAAIWLANELNGHINL